MSTWITNIQELSIFQVNFELVNNLNDLENKVASLQTEKDFFQQEVEKRGALEGVIEKLKQDRITLQDRLLVMENDQVSVQVQVVIWYKVVPCCLYALFFIQLYLSWKC